MGDMHSKTSNSTTASIRKWKVYRLEAEDWFFNKDGFTHLGIAALPTGQRAMWWRRLTG